MHPPGPFDAPGAACYSTGMKKGVPVSPGVAVARAYCVDEVLARREPHKLDAAALSDEAIRFDNGKVLNPRFSEYRVPRFPDTPLMETVLLDRKDLASAGAGETPIVTVAPAVGNAIFAASSIRLRSMPMIPNGLKAPAKEG